MSFKPKRILGDLRIFQAVYNDLKLSNLTIDLQDNTVTGYVYEGIDPYELEDNAFPSVVKAINDHTTQQVLEGSIETLNWLVENHDAENGFGYFIADRIAELESELNLLKENT